MKKKISRALMQRKINDYEKKGKICQKIEKMEQKINKINKMLSINLLFNF